MQFVFNFVEFCVEEVSGRHIRLHLRSEKKKNKLPKHFAERNLGQMASHNELNFEWSMLRKDGAGWTGSGKLNSFSHRNTLSYAIII